jgi:hypothetical protein
MPYNWGMDGCPSRKRHVSDMAHIASWLWAPIAIGLLAVTFEKKHKYKQGKGESNQRIEGTTKTKKEDREGPVEGKDEEKECVKHAAKLPNVFGGHLIFQNSPPAKGEGCYAYYV